MNGGILTAREYLRVSQDRSGRQRSTDEQHDDHVLAGQGHRFTLTGDPYSDESISASRYTTKIRGGFDRLIADLDSGAFAADLLVIWEGSRGSRRVREWLDLLEACERAGVLIFIFTHSRIYDASNGRDRKTLIEDAADSEFESSKTSGRIRRAAAANAAAGRPHGRIPYGYRRRYDPITRKLVAQEPREDEAPNVVEIFERLGKGHSLRQLEIDFAKRRVLTRTGKLFDSSHIRDIASRAAYAGLRVHAPDNPNSGRYLGPLDQAVQATWPALVPAELFFKVRGMLLDSGRRTNGRAAARPGRAKHLLSLIAQCGACRASGLSVAYRHHGVRYYQCKRSGCIQVKADDLDEYGTQVILGYLSRPDVIERLRARGGDGPEVARVRAELAQARSELASWRAAVRARKVTPDTMGEIEPVLLAAITGLEVKEQELTTPAGLSAIPPGEDVALRWAAAELPARRQVARLVLQPSVLGTLYVNRSPRPGNRVVPVPVADRVTWDRDTAA